jgi:hypothetical protein
MEQLQKTCGIGVSLYTQTAVPGNKIQNKVTYLNLLSDPRATRAVALEKNIQISIAETRPTFRDDGQHEVLSAGARV